MAEVKLQNIYRVDIIESERGYGTHCSNDIYELNGWLYDITYEGLTVIDIRRKKI